MRLPITREQARIRLKHIEINLNKRLKQSRTDWAYKIIYNDAYNDTKDLVRELIDLLPKEDLTCSDSTENTHNSSTHQKDTTHGSG